MTTQSVSKQSAMIFGNTVAGSTTKGKPSSEDFDTIMSNNLQMDRNNDLDPASVHKNTTVTRKPKEKSRSNDTDQNNAGKTGNEKDLSKVETRSRTQKSDDSNGKTKDVTKTASEKSGKVNETDGLTKEEELVARVAGVLQVIYEAVMEALKLSTDDLDKLLADQNMTVNDLLQPECLQNLVLAAHGENDITAVLTDENLANTMNELIATVDDIITKANLPLSKEQLTEILANLSTAIDPNTNKDVHNDKVAVNDENLMEGTSEQDDTTLNRVGSSGETSVTLEVDTMKESYSETQSDTNGKAHDNERLNDPFQTFVDHMVQNAPETKVTFAGDMVQVTELREIANQIIERIRILVRPDQTSMELQLNPEHLGKVSLSVQSNNGIMTAQFVVENEMSKEAIESQMVTLRETLDQQGIKVEAIEVTVAAYNFDQNNPNNTSDETGDGKKNSGRKISMEDAMTMEELPEEEVNSSDITGIRGSQVDYTA